MIDDDEALWLGYLAGWASMQEWPPGQHVVTREEMEEKFREDLANQAYDYIYRYPLD